MASGGWGSAYNGKPNASAAPTPSGGWGSGYNAKPAAPATAPTGGWGSAFNAKPAAAAKKSGGGGIFGSIEGALGAGAHWVATKADKAAHDVAAIPTGAVQLGEAEYGVLKNAAEHFTQSTEAGFKGPTGWGALFSHPERWYNAETHPGPGADKAAQLAAGVLKSTATSVEHPLRDPFQTALTVAPAIDAAGRVGIAADAARSGDIAGAAKSLASGQYAAGRLGPRIIQVPKLVAPEGEGPAALAHEPVSLVPSQAPATRLFQAAHDKIVQGALDNNLSEADVSNLTNYANRRVGKVTSEAARTAQRTRVVPAQLLERTGRSFDDGVSKKAGQLALFLRSANVTGDEAARYWGAQAAKGVNPVDTGRLAGLAQHVHDQGILKLGEDGNVHVAADRFPKLGGVDDLVKENQANRAAIISEHGLMSPEGLQTRLDLVAKKMGVEREGQGFASLKTSVKRQPQTPIARARGPVIGRARNFIGGKAATGEGVAKGLIPDNTTAGVARANREAVRYLGTVEHRGLVARYGSDVKRTGEDALIADPAAGKYGEIPTSTNELLGRSQSTLNTVSEDEHLGLAAAMRARLEDSIPGLRDKFQTDRAAALGTRAPQGYKWVPQQQLGELTHDTVAHNPITKRIDSINRTVTAMTVYFKLSHIPQRLTTNATTSLLQGSLSRGGIRDALTMRKALSDREYAEAVAASGTHGYMALPHEGSGFGARAATRGAQFYARRIDSPFRFLNLVHEAKKAGYDTPDKFRQLIDYAKNPTGDHPDAVGMENVLRKANRASMMYDGLGQNEQRILARGLWFYPWTKSAFRYAGHTLGEHPLKSAALGQLGQQGEQAQAQLLGPLPSYEYGLTPFGGGTHPLTNDMSILTPFGTAGNVMEAIARPGSIGGFLNPAYGAGLTAITGINSYGNKTKSPIGDALSELFAPTPEAQILSAWQHPAKPNQIFAKTPLSQLIRAGAGPTFPRPTNRAALASAAAREKAGR